MQNNHSPQQAIVSKVEQLCPGVVLITASPGFGYFVPGQFFMLFIPGFGEAPFGIMQPSSKNELSILVREVGDFTNRLQKIKKGNLIYLHGPYGNGFPVKSWQKKNITMIAGGIGIVPIKALLDYVRINKNRFGNIQLLYGAKTSKEIIFSDELSHCQKFAEVLLTTEKGDRNWQGNIGLITSLISVKTVEKENTVAVLCGPPIMYKFVIEKLKKIGFADTDIYLSLERRIRCGIGKCQHCTCGSKYVCLDGPVFRYDEILKMPDGDI